MSESEEPDSTKNPSLAKEVGSEVKKGLVKEARNTLKWGLGGAIAGGLVLGILGLVKFGVTGLWIGAIAGALIGGIGAVFFYLSV